MNRKMHFRCGKLLHDVFVASFFFWISQRLGYIQYKQVAWDWQYVWWLTPRATFSSFSVICCYFSGLQASSCHYQDRRGLDKDQNGELAIWHFTVSRWRKTQESLSFPVSEISGGSRKSQSRDADGTHVGSQCGFARSVIVQE